MKQKHLRKIYTPHAVEKTLEIIHISYAITPGIAAVITTILRKDLHLLVEAGFIFITIAINFYIFLKPKTEETKSGRGLTLFWTFLTNQIKPVKKPTEQKYKVQVVIVEDKGNLYFKQQLDEQFHKAKKNLVKNEIDENLTFENIQVDPHEAEKIDDEVSKFLADNKLALEKPAAVVVVRSDNLENNSWVYKAIDFWAYENSEIPILFAKNESKEYKHHEIADNYLRIPDDPKSLPWRLLQRAAERGNAWRVQAKYNRAMVWNIFYIALMCIYIAGVLAIDQRKEFSTAYKGQSEVMETKRLFERDILKRSDDQLNVSYWFSHKEWFSRKGHPEVFVTTENLDTIKSFKTSNSSIIGCGFSTPNIIVECKEGCNEGLKKADVFDLWGKPRLDIDCYMTPRTEEPIYSISCATYKPSGVIDDEYIVGICIFTGTAERSVLEGDYHKFLREKVMGFRENFREKLQDKSVTPLSERGQP